jgi:uncharacterized protein
MILDNKSLERIVDGAAFLGSGGGGSKLAGRIFVEVIAGIKKEVELLTFPLPEYWHDRIACIVCDIGSINQFDENQAGALRCAFEALDTHFKPTLGNMQALFPIETGPENTLAAFVMAAFMGIPVIDADGAGRAIPTIPLCSFSALGTVGNPNPVAIANGKGDFMLVNSHDVKQFDHILRKVAGTDVFKSSGSLALWPDKIQTLAKKSVQGTISKALDVGKLLEGVRDKNPALIRESQSALNQTQAYLIGVGRVSETPTKDDANAFQFTVVTLENELHGDKLTVIGQNESLIVFSDKISHPVATAPDSICYLTDKFEPQTNVEIAKEQRIYLIGVRAHHTLSDAVIVNGFRRVLLELGYAGSLLLESQRYEKLGDLLVRLSKENIQKF